MNRLGRIAVRGLAAAVLLAAGPASAFQIQWEPETTRSAARVAGYVINDNLKSTTGIRMRVDRLAADGRVTGTYRSWVPGVLQSGDRAYFTVGVPERDATYRVSVESFQFFRCGD
jgi:hypothetical protein